MAHDLSIRKNGFVEMAYTGERPWHALGQSLPTADNRTDYAWFGAGNDLKSDTFERAIATFA